MTSKKGKIKQYKRWSTGGLDKIGKEGKDKMLVVYSEEMDRINKLEEQKCIFRFFEKPSHPLFLEIIHHIHPGSKTIVG